MELTSPGNHGGVRGTTVRQAAALVALFAVAAAAASANPAPRAASRPTTAPTTPAGYGRLGLPAEFGVNVHFVKPAPGEMAMIAATGASLVRMDLKWDHTEKQLGSYDFGSHLTFVRELEQAGLRPLFILDYGNPLYDGGRPPHSPEGRAAFARWAAAAAKQFAGRGVTWEIWNEPNVPKTWEPVPDPDAYARLAVAAGRAIRTADPAAVVIGPATGGVDLGFLESCFKAGCLDVWDAVSVHPYRRGDPETVAADYRQLRALVRRYAPPGRTVAVAAGEWGYSTAWAGHDATRQAAFLPRCWLTNLSNDVRLSVWYDWRDDGPDPTEQEHNFGLVRHPRSDVDGAPYERKPAYHAMRTATAQLAGYSYQCRLAAGDYADDYVLLFARRAGGGTPAGVKLVAWTTATGGRDVTIPCSPGRFDAVAADGTPAGQLTASAAGLRVAARPTVQYLTPATANDLLTLAAAWEPLPADWLIAAGGRTPLRTALGNPLGAPIRVTAVGPDRAGSPARAPAVVDIEPGRVGELSFPSPTDRTPEGLPTKLALSVAGVGQIGRWVVATPEAPLHLDVAGLANGQAIITLDDPGGPGFEGVVKLEPGGAARPAVSSRVKLAGGRPSTVAVRLPAGGPVARFSVRAESGDARAATTERLLPPMAYTSIQDLAWRAAAGGPAAAGSRVVVRPALPPGGPPAAGLTAVELNYQFGDGSSFAQLVQPKPNALSLPGRPRELRLWVYGDGSGNKVRARYVGADGQTFQPDAGVLNWTGWRRVTFPLDGSTGGRWGGPNDGVVRHPLTLDTLLLIDNAGKKSGGGTVYVSGAMTVE
ncbi:MAG TPA: cellulase family glycosylhydrolase [Humisphaera sp.]